MNEGKPFLGLVLAAFALLVMYRVAPGAAIVLTALLIGVLYAVCRSMRR